MVGCDRKKWNTELFYIVNKLIMDTNWGLFGSNGLWLLVILFFLFFMNGNGFGFGGNNMMWWLLGNQDSNNNHDNTVDILNNNTMWQNQLMAQQNLANQTNLITQGFCSTNSNIEKAILAGQQNTCQIMTNCIANTQKILDKLCEQETQSLRTQLAEARVIAQNNAQTTELLSKLQPVAIPSYIVSSPYTSIYPPATTTASS